MKKLIFLYAFFAGISILVNLGVQSVVMFLRFPVLIAMLFGTGFGLITKYILDKIFIFRYKTRSLAHDFKTFFGYTLMGIVTTFIFWGFELVFNYIFKNGYMTLLGGFFGLVIGYTIKYFLDRKFVFV